MSAEPQEKGGKGRIGDGRGQRPRQGGDRRRSRLPSVRFMLAGGRRQAVRRLADRRMISILDYYSPRLFAVIVGILVLSLLDALLTLYLIDRGASEMNPVMAYFLEKGPLVFMVAKYLLTSLALIIFLLAFNSVSPGASVSYRSLFFFALIAFGLVILWEIALVLLARTPNG